MTRLTRRLPLALLMVVTWALLAVSCGDGTLSKEEYGTELRGMMQELEDSYGAAGDAMRTPSANADSAAGASDAPATVGDIVRDLRATQIGLRDAANRLDELEPPAEIAEHHDELVDGVREMADDVDLLMEAQELAASDAERAAQLAREFAGSEAFERVQRAAEGIQEAGVDAGL